MYSVHLVVFIVVLQVLQVVLLSLCYRCWKDFDHSSTQFSSTRPERRLKSNRLHIRGRNDRGALSDQ